ncbi:MAG: hypothetical protein D6B28_10280 [Gammaproteobacteria bacterium]|nr:MAG: hypothetical protein D6B28_10280 [Gammaproteobacteria bacterium]
MFLLQCTKLITILKLTVKQTTNFFERMTIMYENILERVQEQAEQLTAPLRKIQEVTVAGIERVTQLNVENIKTYAELGMENAKKVLNTNITDVEGLQNFITEQTEVAHNVGLKMTDDLKAYVALGEDLGEELQKVVKENVTLLEDVTKV